MLHTGIWFSLNVWGLQKAEPWIAKFMEPFPNIAVQLIDLMIQCS